MLSEFIWSVKKLQIFAQFQKLRTIYADKKEGIYNDKIFLNKENVEKDIKI